MRAGGAGDGVSCGSRAVVTGATGYVGRSLIHTLRDEGWEISALVQPGTEENAEEGPGIDNVVGDVLDATAVARCLQGADVVYHLAGVMPGRPQPMVAVNVDGTEAVTRAAVEEGVRRLVFLSSAAVYAPGAPRAWPLTEDAPLRRRSRNIPRMPLSPFMASLEVYAWTKLRGERIVRSAHARGRMSVCILRSAEIYGPWRRRFASLLDRARDRPEILLHPASRAPSMQWLHVDDLHDLLLRAGELDFRGPLTVNAAGPQLFSLLNLAVLALPDLRLPPPVHPASLKYAIDLARQRLGWTPTVRLREGLREILAVDARGG